MVFSDDGRYLTDIRVKSTRSWVLNGIGQADFVMAATDPKCRRTFLELGNLLLILHPSLPAWIGVIDKPRLWSNGTVSVRAYEIMKIMQWRRTPENTKLTGTAGAIAQTLVAIGNTEGDMRIRLSVISGDGTPREETMGDSAWVHLQRVRARANNDIVVTYSLTGGRLTAHAQWLAKAGTGEKPLVALVQNKNLEAGDLLSEDGDFYNDLLGKSDASSAGAQITSRVIDTVSINQFGLRQGKKIFYGNRVQGTLDANTAREVKVNGRPRRNASQVALDIGDTFKSLRLGAVLRSRLTAAGFMGDRPAFAANVRIFGMRYTDGAGRCEVMDQEDASGQF
jgi:hypothetical protein